GSDSDEKDGTGCFMAYAITTPDKLEMVSQIMREILSKPKDFTEGELERAKTKLCARLVLGGELPLGRLMSLGLEWNYQKKVHDLDQLIARIRGITKAE